MITTVTNNPRLVVLVSDDGKYVIKGKLVSEADSYTQDNWMCHKTYTGSHWEASIYENGKKVNGIQVRNGNYQPYITLYSVCAHGIKLSKNTLLYTALTTTMFNKALEGINADKVKKQYYKEYVDARIADGTAY